VTEEEFAALRLAVESKLKYLEHAKGIVVGTMSVRPEQMLSLLAENEALRAELAKVRARLTEPARLVSENQQLLAELLLRRGDYTTPRYLPCGCSEGYCDCRG
jgi:regulator of replication initiation timing